MPNYPRRVIDCMYIRVYHPGQTEPTIIFVDTVVLQSNHIFGFKGGEFGDLIGRFWLDEGELSISTNSISSTTGLKLIFCKGNAFSRVCNIIKHFCPQAEIADKQNVYNDRVLNVLSAKLTEQQFYDLKIQLFWSSWIRQVMYYILQCGEDPLYEQFEKTFPYPLLKRGDWRGHTMPYGIMERFSDSRDILEDKVLLKKYMGEYWKPVAIWLRKIGRTDILEDAINEFQRDFEVREFPTELSWILENFGMQLNTIS